jgi:hypothetical protein
MQRRSFLKLFAALPGVKLLENVEPAPVAKPVGTEPPSVAPGDVLDSEINMMTFKEYVDTAASLPREGDEFDARWVEDENRVYVLTREGWAGMAGVVG